MSEGKRVKKKTKLRRIQKPENEKRSTFKKILKMYMVVLTIIMVIFLIYVVKSLKSYEELQIDNFLNKSMQEVANNVPKYIDTSKITLSKYEKKDTKIDEAIGELLKTSKLTYKINNDNIDLTNPIYDVYANGELILKAFLNGERKLTKLAILTVQDWKLEKIDLAKTSGLYTCYIEVPSNLSVYVNDVKLSEAEKTEGEIDEGLKEISNYVQIPYLTKYTIADLIKEPEVKIEDENGQKIEYSKENNTFKVALKNEVTQNEEEFIKNINSKIDIMQIAKDWSLYLTDDLNGTLHGFYNISKYLIKDSYMWNYARKWATNVDITFISSHTLDNPAFTNTKISNYEIYSDKAFSCEVYLEKNMFLTRSGNKKMKDTMNEKMYFAYYQGEWKLVNMQSITNK